MSQKSSSAREKELAYSVYKKIREAAECAVSFEETTGKDIFSSAADTLVDLAISTHRIAHQQYPKMRRYIVTRKSMKGDTEKIVAVAASKRSAISAMTHDSSRYKGALLQNSDNTWWVVQSVGAPDFVYVILETYMYGR
jgi:hypothetical protein